jgi:hypothetical protein
MADYELGQQVTIFRTFTDEGVETDPATVTIEVERPNGSIDEFVFGIDAQVTNPSVGYYELAYLPASPGTYNYRWTSTDPNTAGEGGFTVAVSALGEIVAEIGPCELWVTPEDVADECGSQFTGGSDTMVLLKYAAVASDVLFQLSGGAYAGECFALGVRPCSDACGCWTIALNRGASGWAWDPTAGRWQCGGRSCGCSPLSEVQLHADARRVIEVRIDGVALADDEYRLDPGGRLVRMRDAAEPGRRLLWPSCQIIDLPDTEEGTFAIDYTYGVDPPQSGRDAAAALACQLWLASNNDGRCKLPANTRRAVRGGLTVEIGTLIAESLRAGATGILAVDAFIAAHGGMGGGATVWSPDLTPPHRSV